MSGVLALVGGGEWLPGCDFDRGLLESAGGGEVLILPTGAAYEHPDRLVAAAAEWFGSLGATATGLDVLRRPDASDPEKIEAVRSARFIYLAGGSPMHVRSVLKDTAMWDALVAAWDGGAVVAGSSAGAMVLCDPMVDPRGGALTLGLGLIEQLAIIPQHEAWSEDKERRTLQIAPKDLPIAGIDERTALIRDPDGSWRAEGAGEVAVYVNGDIADLDALPR